MEGVVLCPESQESNVVPVQVFSIFEDLGISVDVVATSEVSISLTLDPSKLWSRELIQQASVRLSSYFLTTTININFSIQSIFK